MKERIVRLRKAAGYGTQQALAKMLGCGITAVQQWEQGKVVPSIEYGIKMTDEFNVSLDFLYLGDDSCHILSHLRNITKDDAKKIVQALDWRPHDIRRTVATRLAGLGYQDEHIHRFLGHTLPILTKTYNLHRYDSLLQEMAEAWEKEIKKIVFSA